MKIHVKFWKKTVFDNGEAPVPRLAPARAGAQGITSYYNIKHFSGLIKRYQLKKLDDFDSKYKTYFLLLIDCCIIWFWKFGRLSYMVAFSQNLAQLQVMANQHDLVHIQLKKLVNEDAAGIYKDIKDQRKLVTRHFKLSIFR